MCANNYGIYYNTILLKGVISWPDVEISVAHRGRPWENGYAERLIRTLKEEEVDINEYESITEARDRIGHFITHVYNLKRPHSALGYLTPNEVQGCIACIYTLFYTKPSILMTDLYRRDK